MKKFLLMVLAVMSLGSCEGITKLNESWAKFTNDNRTPYILQDARKRIADYEWFYDMYAQIEATSLKFRIAKEQKLEEATGISMVLASMISEYNARSRMQTRSMWKAEDLPYEIEMENLK
jgi:hypothetical protein